MANSWFDPPLVRALPPAVGGWTIARLVAWVAAGAAVCQGAGLLEACQRYRPRDPEIDRPRLPVLAAHDSQPLPACACAWVQQIMYCAFGGLAALILSGWYITVTFGGIYAPVPLLLVAIWYNFIYMRPVPGDTAKYITFHDAALERKYGQVRSSRLLWTLAGCVLHPGCVGGRRIKSRSPCFTRLTLTATSSSRAMFWSAQRLTYAPLSWDSAAVWPAR